MKYIVALLVLVSIFISGTGTTVHAQEYRPRLSITQDIQVTSENVTLGDIAKIEGSYSDFSKLIDDLKAVPLSLTLRPLESTSIPGSKILDFITAKGIPLDAFGYSIPVEIKIIRDGQAITKEEITNIARSELQSDADLELHVKGVEWESEQIVPRGEIKYSIERLGAPDRGKMPIRVTAHQGERIAAKFLATALVDDWRSIPVIRGRLDRGSVIGSADIQMIRSNLASLPIDVALNEEEIRGKRVTRSLTSGDPVRKSDLDIPPVIERGKLVKMIYQNGSFTASASGIALEPGFENDVIQLRNDRSNKTVRGKVVNADEVLVLK